MIRLLLVDDHQVLLQSLAFLLNRDPEIEVVGQAMTGAAAIQQAQTLQPDVLLLDLHLPDMHGITVIQQVLHTQAAIQILLLTADYEEDLVRDALLAGARGYLRKETSTQAVIRAIHAVVSDGALIFPALASAVVAPLRAPAPPAAAAVSPLTERERTVVRLLAEGRSNKEIGYALGISENTVKHHLTAILQKLHLTDRTQLVVYAIRHQLL